MNIAAGLEMATNELPDHVPLFLEVLGNIEPTEARSLLDEAITFWRRWGTVWHATKVRTPAYSPCCGQ